MRVDLDKLLALGPKFRPFCRIEPAVTNQRGAKRRAGSYRCLLLPFGVGPRKPDATGGGYVPARVPQLSPPSAPLQNIRQFQYGLPVIWIIDSEILYIIIPYDMQICARSHRRPSSRSIQYISSDISESEFGSAVLYFQEEHIADLHTTGASPSHISQPILLWDTINKVTSSNPEGKFRETFDNI